MTRKYHLFTQKGFKEFSYSKYGYPLMRETVARTLPGNFLLCADIQKDVHEELYADIVHYSPKTTEMVAGRMRLKATRVQKQTSFGLRRQAKQNTHGDALPGTKIARTRHSPFAPIRPAKRGNGQGCESPSGAGRRC